MRGPAVVLEGVAVHYVGRDGVTPALTDVSFEVADAEFVAIVGPSGCGKSTLLSVIAGLVEPSTGLVEVSGESVKGPRGHVGYMLQRDHLFEWRTILDNVMLGIELRGLDRRAGRRHVSALLQRYGLGGFEDSYPSELSGGMRQRVALIRTLATDPSVLLLDEPFSALDFQTRLMMNDEVANILRREGKTAILVTHDIAEAISMADRVIVISDRPGRVIAQHKFEFRGEGRDAVELRSSPEFLDQFQTIWGELGV